MDNAAPPPSARMTDLIFGFWTAKAIRVAAILGVADHIEAGPKTAEELAGLVGAHGPSLHRLLRALASVGIFKEDDRRRFAPTPLGSTLRSGVPGSLRDTAISMLDDGHGRCWDDLLHSLRTGEIACDHVHGTNIWDYYAHHPEEERAFNGAMTGLSQMVGGAVVEAYDFSPFGKIVDVAGGQGSLLSQILRATPKARGVLFDAPRVVEGAGPNLEAAGVADRVERIGGDFFESVPAGGDLYTLKWIVHDWDDERSLAILKNCRRAMHPGARLLLVEAVIPPGNEPMWGKFLDLNMLVITGGKERTEREFAALLASAGLRLTRVIPTKSPVSIVEAEPEGT
jgi:hypothetical protein